MQILGLYISSPRNILITLKELHNAQLFLPIVFTLTNPSSTPLHHISIFPAFYSVDRWATIPQSLVRLFCKDQRSYYKAIKADRIRELTIYLIDSSDMPSIYALAKNMALNFPQIGWLCLCFEHQCEIVSFLLTVDTTTAPNLKGLYCHSHHLRLKNSSLFSPICVMYTYAPISGPWHNGNPD